MFIIRFEGCFWEKSKAWQILVYFSGSALLTSEMAFHSDENIHRNSSALRAEHLICCLPVKYQDHFDHVLVNFSECGPLVMYEFNYGLTAAQGLQKLRPWDILKRKFEDVAGASLSFWLWARFTSIGVAVDQPGASQKCCHYTALGFPRVFIERIIHFNTCILCKISLEFFVQDVSRIPSFKESHC